MVIRKLTESNNLEFIQTKATADRVQWGAKQQRYGDDFIDLRFKMIVQLIWRVNYEAILERA